MKAIFTYPNNAATSFIDPLYVGDASDGFQKRIQDLKDGNYLPWAGTAPVDTVSDLMSNISKFNDYYMDRGDYQHVSIHDMYLYPLLTGTITDIQQDITATLQSNTIAEPSVITSSSHQLTNGSQILLSNFDGSLSAINNTSVYAKVIDQNTLVFTSDSALTLEYGIREVQTADVTQVHIENTSGNMLFTSVAHTLTNGMNISIIGTWGAAIITEFFAANYPQTSFYVDVVDADTYYLCTNVGLTDTIVWAQSNLNLIAFDCVIIDDVNVILDLYQPQPDGARIRLTNFDYGGSQIRDPNYGPILYVKRIGTSSLYEAFNDLTMSDPYTSAAAMSTPTGGVGGGYDDRKIYMDQSGSNWVLETSDNTYLLPEERAIMIRSYQSVGQGSTTPWFCKTPSMALGTDAVDHFGAPATTDMQYHLKFLNNTGSGARYELYTDKALTTAVPTNTSTPNFSIDGSLQGFNNDMWHTKNPSPLLSDQGTSLDGYFTLKDDADIGFLETLPHPINNAGWFRGGSYGGATQYLLPSEWILPMRPRKVGESGSTITYQTYKGRRLYQWARQNLYGNFYEMTWTTANTGPAASSLIMTKTTLNGAPAWLKSQPSQAMLTDAMWCKLNSATGAWGILEAISGQTNYYNFYDSEADYINNQISSNGTITAFYINQLYHGGQQDYQFDLDVADQSTFRAFAWNPVNNPAPYTPPYRLDAINTSNMNTALPGAIISLYSAGFGNAQALNYDIDWVTPSVTVEEETGILGPNTIVVTSGVVSTQGTMFYDDPPDYALTSIDLIIPGDADYTYKNASNVTTPGAEVTSTYQNTSGTSFAHPGTPNITLTTDAQGRISAATLNSNLSGYSGVGEIVFGIEALPDQYVPPAPNTAADEDIFDTQDAWTNLSGYQGAGKMFAKDVIPTSASITYVQPSTTNMSQNGRKYVRSSGFVKTKLEVNYTNLTKAEFQELHADAQAARGQAATFYLVVALWGGKVLNFYQGASRSDPRLVTPYVAGETLLKLGGFNSNEQDVFKKGEMIIGNNGNENGDLLTVLNTVDANVYGEAKIRVAYGNPSSANNGTKIFKNPYWIVVSLDSDDFQYTVDTFGLYNVTVGFETGSYT